APRFLTRRFDSDGDSAGVGELHRIADEIDQHLPQLGLIAVDEHWAISRDTFEPQSELFLLRWQLEYRAEIPGQSRQVEVRGGQFHPAGIDFREIQNLVDQVQQV